MRPIPKSMKMPKDRRNVWRGGVLQIWVTRACDKACFGCTQGSNLGGKPGMMTPEQFEQAAISLKGYFGVVGVFGGNPCIHPKFPQLCEILEKHIPFEQRGLWSNNLNGHGPLCRQTFNHKVSNLNTHLDQAAYDEIRRDWPEAGEPNLKPCDSDSRHSPPFVAMQDMEDMNDEERWNLIARCDVNQFWSAMIGVFRGELRAWFCELAGAQAMLHQHEPGYPDTGLPVTEGWWKKSADEFAHQIRYHCMACGIPLRGFGQLAVGGEFEQVSKTHLAVYSPKTKGRPVELVSITSQLGDRLPKATDYVQNSTLEPK